ncbi:MAG: M24 family metallopeptidase [Clostridia bacterium]
MLTNIMQALKKYNKQVWIMYNKDNNDKYFCKYISNNLSTNSICIISQTLSYLLIHNLDKENISYSLLNEKNLKILLYENTCELKKNIEDIIACLNFPNDISFSYSTMGDSTTDVLTHGEYISLKKLIKEPYKKYLKNIKISSAQNLIYEIASAKTPKQLERLNFLAKVTANILDKSFQKIKVNMTEQDIVKVTQNITCNIMTKYVNLKQLLAFDVAWDNCPIVLTGENFLKGGHSLPSNKKLNYGDTIYFDFGLKATFNDKEILYTDIQRMGYALKVGQTSPPYSVMKVFETLKHAIEDGIDEMKPGKKGFEIDTIVRKKITSSFVDYNHATGHSVGLKVHDLGAVISIKGSKLSNLELVENGVYTLEPRISIENGGSIEEMIQVTKYGGKPLCNTQQEIYLI